MISDIKIGEYYRLELKRSIWKNVYFNVRISGITKKNSTEIFNSYDVKNELFMEYDIGMTTFLKTYTDEIDVYIVNLVSKLSPIEYEDDVFFIPKSCIDYLYSERLLETFNLTFTIGGINYYPEEYENIDKYIRTGIERLKNETKYIQHFISETLDIKGTKESVYKRESEVCAEKDRNKVIYQNYQNAKAARIIKEEEIRNDYIESRIRNDMASEKLEQKTKELELNYASITQQQTINANMNKSLNIVAEKLKLIIESKLKPKGEQLNIPVPSFEQLMAEANQEIGPSIVEDE